MTASRTRSTPCSQFRKIFPKRLSMQKRASLRWRILSIPRIRPKFSCLANQWKCRGPTEDQVSSSVTKNIRWLLLTGFTTLRTGFRRQRRRCRAARRYRPALWKLPDLTDGASKLTDGSSTLNTGLTQLTSNVPCPESGSAQLPAASRSLIARFPRLRRSKPAKRGRGQAIRRHRLA